MKVNYTNQIRVFLEETDTLLDNASDITELLLDGFVGLNETPDIEIKDEWNQIFGED